MTIEQKITYAALVILMVAWAFFGFVMLCAEEWGNWLERRKNRKEKYARNHFRQTERFRNDV